MELPILHFFNYLTLNIQGQFSNFLEKWNMSHKILSIILSKVILEEMHDQQPAKQKLGMVLRLVLCDQIKTF